MKISAPHAINVILADDHTLVREGLTLILQSAPGIRIIAQASNGQELIDATARLLPEIVIADLRMPVKSGVDAIREIAAFSKTRCIALSMYENEFSIVEALEAGAIGYISKRADIQEFLEAVKSAYEGHPYYCKSTSVKMVQLLAKSSFNPYARTTSIQFSAIEEKIIALICRELSSKEIADQMLMGKRNVDLYRTRILEKMKVKTSAGVAIYAIKNNIVSLDDISAY